MATSRLQLCALIGGILLLLVVPSIPIFGQSPADPDCARLQTTLDSLRFYHRLLEGRVGSDDYREEFWHRQASLARENQAMLLHEAEIRVLQRAGLREPVRQLREDLLAHPEIIPFPGHGFFALENVALLNTRWVFARFEDGHRVGSCLLEYAIAPDSTIHWTLLQAFLE